MEKEIQRGEEPHVFRQRIQGGYYSNINRFLNDMKEYLKKINADIQFTCNHIQKRIETHLRFHLPQAYMLGVVPGKWNKFDKRMPPYPVGLKAVFYHIYSYSDVVRPQLVGDAYALFSLENRGYTRNVQGCYHQVF